MNKNRSWILPLLVVLALAGCNTGASKDSQGKTEKAPPNGWLVAKTPEELGKKIGDDYWNMMDEVKAMVAPRPSIDELRPKLKALKDKYIDRFVAYGKQRQAMSQQERSTVTTPLATKCPVAAVKRTDD
ncbi:MAG: hypothetical protein AB1631_20535 [Acidobacteriota bacterium]